MNVYVIFVEETGPWFLQLLNHGFKHCFMAISYDNIHWIIVDHLYPYTSLKILSSSDIEEELKQWSDKGHTIIKTNLNETISENAHFGILTCVETTKRIMKINNMLIQTPWQLYNYIIKNMPHIIVNEKSDSSP